MKKTNLPRSFRSYIPFFLCVIVLTIAIPRIQKFGYEYERGQQWKYDTLVSEFEFPIYKTEDQLKEEYLNNQSNAAPFYRYSDETVINKLNAIDEIELGDFEYLRDSISISARDVYTRGIIPDELTDKDASGDISDGVLYISKDKRSVKYPASEVLKLHQARELVAKSLSNTYPDVNIDSVLMSSGALDCIVPNLVYDRQMTEIMKRDERNAISPTKGYIASGVTLVNKGEIVTAETEQILDSYSREYATKIGGDLPTFMMWLINLLIALVMTAIYFLVLFFISKGTFKRYGELHYVTFIFLLTSISVILLSRSELKNYILLVPIPLAARYLEAFFKDKVILSVYIVCLLPLILIDTYGPGYFVMYLLAGLTAVLVSQRLQRGLVQFLVVLVIFGVMAVCYFVLRGFYTIGSGVVDDLIKMLIGSFLCMALYPLVFLFERIFGLVSDSRLEELSDTGNRLLRQLELTAPGTFQHSLQVMNMCTYAARAIEADEHLLRAAALYHDIGKMNNPMCFVENATTLALQGQGYHDSITPQQSASDIIRHVSDGIELAEKNHIPRQIREFINSHHGTTTVGFFYNKYVNDGGDPADKTEFQYKGEVPRTKEQIILMLCDSVEAGSRTIKDGTPEKYSEFIERIFALKMEEGQFDKADITFEELVKVKESLKAYLSRLYHERVEYPKRNR